MNEIKTRRRGEDAFAWRPQLAKDIAAVYAGHDGLRFMILGGSIGRGGGDAWSDMDILAYWDRVDAAWLETAPLEPHGARRFTWRVTFPNEVWLEQYMVGDQKIDVAHVTMDWWEKIVREVVEETDGAPWKQAAVGGLLDATCLHGEDEFAKWQERCARYTDAMAEHMIRTHLFFYPRWVLENQGVARGDAYAFFDVLEEMIRNVLGVLAAVNRRYVGIEKLKRIGEIADAMPIRPENLGTRLEALFKMAPADVPAALDQIIRETMDIADEHFPGAVTARKREMLDFQLPAVREKPEFGRP